MNKLQQDCQEQTSNESLVFHLINFLLPILIFLALISPPPSLLPILFLLRISRPVRLHIGPPARFDSSPSSFYLVTNNCNDIRPMIGAARPLRSWSPYGASSCVIRTRGFAHPHRNLEVRFCLSLIWHTIRAHVHSSFEAPRQQADRHCRTDSIYIESSLASRSISYNLLP